MSKRFLVFMAVIMLFGCGTKKKVTTEKSIEVTEKTQKDSTEASNYSSGYLLRNDSVKLTEKEIVFFNCVADSEGNFKPIEVKGWRMTEKTNISNQSINDSVKSESHSKNVSQSDTKTETKKEFQEIIKLGNKSVYIFIGLLVAVLFALLLASDFKS